MYIRNHNHVFVASFVSASATATGRAKAGTRKPSYPHTRAHNAPETPCFPAPVTSRYRSSALPANPHGPPAAPQGSSPGLQRSVDRSLCPASGIARSRAFARQVVPILVLAPHRSFILITDLIPPPCVLRIRRQPFLAAPKRHPGSLLSRLCAKSSDVDAAYSRHPWNFISTGPKPPQGK